MAGYGWSYLTVVHEEGAGDAALDTGVASSVAPGGAAAPQLRASDDSAFASEEEMFRELGVTGWELVALRASQRRLIYYFKRPRT